VIHHHEQRKVYAKEGYNYTPEEKVLILKLFNCGLKEFEKT